MMIPMPEMWPKRKPEIIAALIVLTVLVVMIIYNSKRKLRPELEAQVSKMHPTVQNRFRKFIREIENKTAYRVEIASAWRGWPDSLRIWQTYPQVQACCQPGQDYHMYGLAADIVLHGPNGERLGNASGRAAWEQTGIRKIARKYGLQWGIDFNGYYDPVHFAYPKWPMDAIVKRARERYGSLANTAGNRMSMKGLPTRTWQTA
jgi:hypothetical protein